MQLDMQAKHFTFFDASSPLYMVVNTEVAEGSPLEIFPTVMKRLGYLLLAAFFVGSLAYLWGSKQVSNIRFRKYKQLPTIWDRSSVLRLKKSKKNKSTD
jgi:small-conductance mechanosensitive channel